MSRFIEVSDSGGLVTVFQVELDGYTRIHRTLLEELLRAGGYKYEEGER